MSNKIQQVTINTLVPSKVWDKAFGGTSDDGISSLVTTPDGNFLLTGNSSSVAGSGNKTASAYGYSDFWVVKIK